MNKMRVMVAVIGFVTISISANSFAQVPITIAEVGSRVAQPTNWTHFKNLVNTTPLGSSLLPSTLETGWKNSTFQLITLHEVWLKSPSQLRNLLGIDEATARFLMDLTASQLEIGRTKLAVTGALERLTGEIPPELAEAFRKRGVLIGAPPGPLDPPIITIEDPVHFVKQYKHARETRPTHGCDVEFCIKSDNVASYSMACKNFVTMTFTNGGEASFSLAAKSVDGTSVNVSFSVNKQ